MDKEIWYPSLNKIVECNYLALSLFRVKKSDQAKLLNGNHILKIIDQMKEDKGDEFDKALILLKGIIKKHPFASGNRRTAFIILKIFLQKNNIKIKIVDKPENARTMLGIREGFYDEDEILEWIKNGKIRTFRR